MSSRANRRLLTALHGLLIIAMVAGSLVRSPLLPRRRWLSWRARLSKKPPPVPEVSPAQATPLTPEPPPVDLPLNGLAGKDLPAAPSQFEPFANFALPTTPVGLKIEMDRYTLQRGENEFIGEGTHSLKNCPFDLVYWPQEIRQSKRCYEYNDKTTLYLSSLGLFFISYKWVCCVGVTHRI